MFYGVGSMNVTSVWWWLVCVARCVNWDSVEETGKRRKMRGRKRQEIMKERERTEEEDTKGEWRFIRQRWIKGQKRTGRRRERGLEGVKRWMKSRQSKSSGRREQGKTDAAGLGRNRRGRIPEGKERGERENAAREESGKKCKRRKMCQEDAETKGEEEEDKQMKMNRWKQDKRSVFNMENTPVKPWSWEGEDFELIRWPYLQG